LLLGRRLGRGVLLGLLDRLLGLLRLGVLVPRLDGRGEPGDEGRVETGAFQGLTARTYALLHSGAVWSTNLCPAHPAPASLYELRRLRLAGAHPPAPLPSEGAGTDSVAAHVTSPAAATRRARPPPPASTGPAPDVPRPAPRT